MQKISFPYFICKVISTKENEHNGIKIYSGQAPISSFVKIDDNANVRSYTVEASKTKRSSDVHHAIKETLENNPNNLALLNNGITIVSNSVAFNEKSKELILEEASIINGSQTRGVIKDFIEASDDHDKNISIKFEIIEAGDKDLVSDISIARNTQIRVEKISIMGKQGIFDTLNKAIGDNHKLKTSETDRGKEYLPTERILQVIASLIPKEIWEATGNKEYSKAPYYSRQSRALNLYKEIYEQKEDKKKALYNFYIDIAKDAWNLYKKWSSHAGFRGTGLKNGIDRDSNNNIVRVYDGLIFPIIAAHALFIKKEKNKWTLSIDRNQEENIDRILIDQAKRLFQEIAQSKAEKMGKDQTCYSHLYSLLEVVINNPLNHS